MKIVIIGAGKVGYALAQQLSTENHDIIVIDNDFAALTHADDTLDVMCIKGNGASVQILKEAKISDSDLLIAVTNEDELNMICCVIGKKLGVKHTIARIRNTDYSNDEHEMLKKELELDMVINPEMDAAAEIFRLLQLPQAANVETFAHNLLEMVEFRVLELDPIINMDIQSVMKKLPTSVLFCAVKNNNKLIIPKGDYVFSQDDVVYVIGERANITKFFKYLGRTSHKTKNVTIIGGSRITIYLTWLLQEIGMDVKIIEINKERCIYLNEETPKALIIQGDGTDQDVLDNENINYADAFVALTDRDEENLISSLYAYQCEVPKVILKINRLNYIPIVKKLGLDSIISPKQTTANYIIRYVRALDNSFGSAVDKLYKILDGEAEVAEFTANSTTRELGMKFKNIALKKDVIIAAIVRNKKIIIPFGNDYIEEGDKVIVVAKSGFLFDLNDIYND